MRARLPEGYGGGPQNMNAMIKQAQKMQEEMAQKQEALNEREYKASVGGGALEVVMSGTKELKSVTMKPEIVDPEDIEMLQDLVVAAVNEVIRNVEEDSSAEMEKITGAMPIPGMF